MIVVKHPTLWTTSFFCAASVLALSACGQNEEIPNDPVVDDDQSVAGDARIHSENDDLWVRAAAESEMTALFGTIENLTNQELEIVSAHSPATDAVELHEIVPDEDGVEVMREIEGGFPIPAEGALDMEPGGDHLMFMDLHEQLIPGDLVEVSLEFADGTTESIEAIVKDDGGQDEPYEEGAHGSHGDHGDHGSHDDHEGSHGETGDEHSGH